MEVLNVSKVYFNKFRLQTILNLKLLYFLLLLYSSFSDVRLFAFE